MKITFVANGWEQLGISLLSAIAKAHGHEVSLAFSVSLFNDRFHLTYQPLADFFDDTKYVLQAIEKQCPDVIAFSPVTGTYQWMVYVAEQAKKMFPHAKIIFGGVHTTAVPERVLSRPFIDYVCVGEADIAFPMILDAIKDGGTHRPIPNTRYKLSDGSVVRGPQMGFIQNLDSLPIFDKTLWEDYMQFKESYITMGSRGCPYRCIFCFNNFFAKLPENNRPGRYVRYRSVAHLMNELKIAKKRYGFKLIEFFDDVFTLNKRWLKDFLNEYKREINVPFQIFTHIKFIDEEVVRWLADAGCRSAQIGIQSMDDRYKREVLHRNETTEDIEKALRIMKKYKVLAKFDHMFGLPEEPIEAQETAFRFYLRRRPYRVQTYWANFYPGTEMFKRAIETGLISREDAEKIYEGEGLDSFTRHNSFIDPKKVPVYKGYEAIFKLMVGLPVFLSRRINPKFFTRLPIIINSFITLISDITIGFLRLDIDHFCYAKYYLYHIYRFFLLKIGVKPPPATRVKVDEPFIFKVSYRISQEYSNDSKLNIKEDIQKITA